MTGWKRVADLRTLVYVAAAAVAVFAFIVSYSHIYDLGREHAQSGVAGRLLPLSVDLLIVAASLVLFIQSGSEPSERWLERWLPRFVLWAGIGATVAANVAYGLPHGWLAAVISGWPGAAFVMVVEMVMITVRRTGQKTLADVPQRVTPPVTAWRPDPIRKIATDEGCAPKTEQLVQRRERAAVKAASNGHANGNGNGPH